jgi:hypothetical protein
MEFGIFKRLRRAYSAICEFPVALPLTWHVGQVEACLVGARQLPQLRRAPQAQPLVAAQRLGHLDCPKPQTSKAAAPPPAVETHRCDGCDADFRHAHGPTPGSRRREMRLGSGMRATTALTLFVSVDQSSDGSHFHQSDLWCRNISGGIEKERRSGGALIARRRRDLSPHIVDESGLIVHSRIPEYIIDAPINVKSQNSFPFILPHIFCVVGSESSAQIFIASKWRPGILFYELAWEKDIVGNGASWAATRFAA